MAVWLFTPFILVMYLSAQYSFVLCVLHHSCLILPVPGSCLYRVVVSLQGTGNSLRGASNWSQAFSWSVHLCWVSAGSRYTLVAKPLFHLWLLRFLEYLSHVNIISHGLSYLHFVFIRASLNPYVIMRFEHPPGVQPTYATPGGIASQFNDA